MKMEPRSPSTESAADAMLRLSGAGLQLHHGPQTVGNPTTSCSSSIGVRAMLPSSPGGCSTPGGSTTAVPPLLGPMTLKDEQYWVKRRKNNVAARRSREKRRINDAEMNIRIRQLIQQNQKLEDELAAVKLHCGLPLDVEFTGGSTVKKRPPQVHRGLPVVEQKAAAATLPRPPGIEQTWSESETPRVADTSSLTSYTASATAATASAGVAYVTRPSVFPGLPAVVSTRRPSVEEPGDDAPRSYDDDDFDEQEAVAVKREIDVDESHVVASCALHAMLKCKVTVGVDAGDSEPDVLGVPAKMRYRNWRASETDSPSAKHDSTDSRGSSPLDADASSLSIADFDASLPPDDALRYIERRRRNNMAARKCRENRKKQNTMRVAKSSILETENDKLKLELRSLTEEYTSLYRLMETKKRRLLPSATAAVGGATVAPECSRGEAATRGNEDSPLQTS